MKIAKQLLGRLAQKDSEAIRKRAEREFARSNNAAGVARLRMLAEEDGPPTMYRLGECYELGIGVIQNFIEAVHWYERAALHGSLGAMVKLGDIYMSGRIIRIGGHSADASISLGSNCFRPKGISVPQDFAKAFHWNNMAAEAGKAEAQARLGCQYANGLGVRPDYVKAEKWFLASAEQGNDSGQFGLGALYASTHLGKADNAKAAMWFERAADQGNSAAKLCLALLLIDGAAVSPDPNRAGKLLTEAAEAGQTEAMFRLGQFYRTGFGEARNLADAETWLRRAGARRHIPALSALAQLLMEDLETPDFCSAAAVLREAADLGDVQAQMALRQLYDRDPAAPPIPPGPANRSREPADYGAFMPPGL